MQYISFQCKQCESEVNYNPSQLEVPIGSGIRCPFCGAHYVLELIPINQIRSEVYAAWYQDFLKEIHQTTGN